MQPLTSDISPAAPLPPASDSLILVNNGVRAMLASSSPQCSKRLATYVRTISKVTIPLSIGVSFLGGGLGVIVGRGLSLPTLIGTLNSAAATTFSGVAIGGISAVILGTGGAIIHSIYWICREKCRAKRSSPSRGLHQSLHQSLQERLTKELNKLTSQVRLDRQSCARYQTLALQLNQLKENINKCSANPEASNCNATDTSPSELTELVHSTPNTETCSVEDTAEPSNTTPLTSNRVLLQNQPLNLEKAFLPTLRKDTAAVMVRAYQGAVILSGVTGVLLGAGNTVDTVLAHLNNADPISLPFSFALGCVIGSCLGVVPGAFLGLVLGVCEQARERCLSARERKHKAIQQLTSRIRNLEKNSALTLVEPYWLYDLKQQYNFIKAAEN